MVVSGRSIDVRSYQKDVIDTNAQIMKGVYAHSRSHFVSRRLCGCPERLLVAPCLNSDGAVKHGREGASLLWCKQKADWITKQNTHTQLGAPCGDGYVALV